MRPSSKKLVIPKYLDDWKLLNRRKSFSLKSAVRDIDLARGPHLISMWPQVSVPFKITKMRKNYSRLLRPLQQTASTRQTRQRSRRQRFVPSIGNIGNATQQPIFLKVDQCQPHENFQTDRHCFQVVNLVKTKPSLAGNQIPFGGKRLGFVYMSIIE